MIEHYAIRFIPRENGVHWVHVRFNGRDIPDSPFRVTVGHANADPGRVFASGAGLYQGETGKSRGHSKKVHGFVLNFRYPLRIFN